MANASRPPGEWQTYDILFTAPQFYTDSSLKSAARITVFHNGVASRTAADGKFELKDVDPSKPVLVKASGYRQTSVSVSDSRTLKVVLKPFDAKGLYLTHFGVSSKLLRNRVLGLIEETELNAVVIDVKGDRGLLSSRYDIPLAAEIGSLKLPTIKDARAFVADLHQRNNCQTYRPLPSSHVGQLPHLAEQVPTL